MEKNKFIDLLSKYAGISESYHDIWGNLHYTDIKTKKAILNSMGIKNLESPEEALKDYQKNQWVQIIPQVFVFKEDANEIKLRLNIPDKWLKFRLNWIIEAEKSGNKTEADFIPENLKELESITIGGVLYKAYELSLDVRNLIFGYHKFYLNFSGSIIAEMTLICTPLKAYKPDSINNGQKLWGPALQIYSLRSSRNFGIGDFADIKKIMEIFAGLGGSIVGINPINALFPANPYHISPYSPSSRNFLNYIYLALDEIEEFHEAPSIKTMFEEDLNSKIEKLKQLDYISYNEVGKFKFSVLEKIWEYFKENKIKQKTERGADFIFFINEKGKNFYFALFNVLWEYFHKNQNICCWSDWPEDFKDKNSEAVKKIANENIDRINFYQFLEWLCIQQLQIVGNKSLELGLNIGLYGDLPVSVDPNGFDVWFEKDVYAGGIGIGAPPDDFNLKGQNWGLIPFNPLKLKEYKYEPFISILRYNMKYVGAIRIDHIMSLMRLFWIPNGMKCSDGAYVNYILDDMMGILALESQRNMTLLIGEDLGTVPDIVREKMHEWGIFSYKVMYFQKNHDGSFKSPDQYEPDSLLTVSTHDLPTLKGFWNFRDIEIRTLLDLFPNDEIRRKQIETRENDRKALSYLLMINGLITEHQAIDILSKKDIDINFLRLIYFCLAKSKSFILMLQLEDIMLESEQINLPGTVKTYPNWSRKYTKRIEDLNDNGIRELLERINEIRK